MKIFTLKEAERYFCIYNNISQKKNNLVNETNIKKRDFLTLEYAKHLHAIRNEEDEKFRILYLIRRFTNYDKDYKLKDFQIIGNYKDVILRLEIKNENDNTLIQENWN